MTIWKHAFTIEEANRHSVGTAAGQLGIEMTDVGADFITGRMPVDHRTRQPMGVLHGGASILFAETLASWAATFAAGPDRFTCVGQEINGNHVRSVTEGWVYGTARPHHIGRSSQVWGIEITDEAGRLVCVSRLTVAVIARPTQFTGNGAAGTSGS